MERCNKDALCWWLAVNFQNLICSSRDYSLAFNVHTTIKFNKITHNKRCKMLTYSVACVERHHLRTGISFCTAATMKANSNEIHISLKMQSRF